jgi:glycine/D-amino acid oxidase-like deaminating enzyme
MNNYTNFDCIVIGGGITGSALAYELAKHKLKVLLLEKDILPNNATTNSYGGLSYWSATNDLTSSLFSQGIELYRHLEDELEQKMDFRELDLLLTINNSDHPQEIFSNYNHCAIQPELLDIKSACKLEPLLSPNSISGALKLPYAHVHPSKVNWAYQNAFKRLGGEIRHETITKFLHRENQVQGVQTNVTKYSSAQTIICAGGFSRNLLASLEISSNLFFTHCIVLKTPPQKEFKLNTVVMSARVKRFTLEARASQQEAQFLWSNPSPEAWASIVDSGAVQFEDGSIALGQVSHIISDINPMDNLSTSQEQIQSGIAQILPSLSKLTVSRHESLVSFSDNPEHPKMGKIPQWSGLSLFGGFRNTILIAPPMARHLANHLAKDTKNLFELS